MMGLALASLLVLPNPDGTIVFADRQQFLHLYSGLVPFESEINFLLSARPSSWTFGARCSDFSVGPRPADWAAKRRADSA